MKLLLVSPPFGEKGQMSKGLPIAPPVLEYLTGLTNQIRPDIRIELLDANNEVFLPEKVEADLIGFTVLTPQAPWVYSMADRLRAGGKKVILGGIHVTALPEETFRMNPDAEYIASREPEYTIRDFALALSDKSPMAAASSQGEINISFVFLNKSFFIFSIQHVKSGPDWPAASNCPCLIPAGLF